MIIWCMARPPLSIDVTIGDIHLVSAYTLRGKVGLSDGKSIPPEMRVT